MKGLFLSIVAILLTIALIRFGYGLGANSLEFSIDYILSLVPDVKEDFSLFIEGVRSFSDALSGISNAFSGDDFIEVVKSFFNSIGSFFNLFIVLIPCILAFLKDTVRMLVGVFELLFGTAVDPIVAPK